MTRQQIPPLSSLDRISNQVIWKGCGYSGGDLSRPVIGIANAFSDMVPGHTSLRELARQVKYGIYRAGGVPAEFGVIACCDGLAGGHDGNNYVLPSRDNIADSIEIIACAHRLDGLVLLGSCDKIVPGMLMAAARLDLPCVLVAGGGMLSGPDCCGQEKPDTTSVSEAMGRVQVGELTEDDVLRLADLCAPTCGSCQFMGTANSMCCMAEAMGMSLPGSAAVPAVYARRMQIAYETGRTAVSLVERGLTARKIITKESMENAVRVLMGIGGSTNGIMHLQAIHREAGLGDLPLSAFDALSHTTPQVASVYPASPYDMADFDEAGGVQAVMKELESLLHGGCVNVTGRTVAETLRDCPGSVRPEVIRPIKNPFAATGGVAVLRGNLAPLGAVAKPAAIPEQLMRIQGRAQVFHSEQEACRAILKGRVEPGRVVVLRYEGPKGGPGMPEMYRPMKCLEGMGLSETCALITDGRFSGSNRGCFVGHISPEAYEGGTLALVEDGDEILIDVPGRKLELLVEETVLEQRRRRWTRPGKDVPDGYLNVYRALSRSAAQGAVLGLD